MTITEVPIKTLKPYAKNAKLHDAKQIANVANSIKRFGWQQPLVIDDAGVVVIGHCRLLAAKKLGMKTVPVTVASGLTEEEIRELRIADNKTNESPWDVDLLAEDLDGLCFDGFDFDFGLPGEEEEPAEITEDNWDKPLPEEPRSKRGDIWQLGRHRLMCGDSTLANDVIALMNGAKARMVFTDPPWNVNYGAEEEGNPMGYKPRTILNDFMGTEEFKKFMDSAFRCMNTASEPGAMTYVVMSAQEWGNMMLTLAGNDYHWSSTIIWNKDRLVLSRKDYHTKYEPIWYGWKNGEARLHPLTDRKQCDVWDFERPKVSAEHPTMKPIGLVAQAVQNSSNKGDPVLDLFGGSGTTLLACEQTDRDCYMMELDPKYVDVIIDRWETFTGGKAVLLNG